MLSARRQLNVLRCALALSHDMSRREELLRDHVYAQVIPDCLSFYLSICISVEFVAYTID